MAFWFAVFLFLGTALYGYLTRPRPGQNKPTASGLGDFSLPTADATRAIPVIFGLALVRGGNVIWYGDLRNEPITKKVRTSLFSSEDVVIGYRYYLGVQLALCHGTIDEIRRIYYDDKVVPIVQSTLGDHIRIVADDRKFKFFGMKFGLPEVGLDGAIDFYTGTNSQGPNDYLEAKTGGARSGYPTLAYAMFRQTYFGQSPFIRPISLEVGRWPDLLGLTGSRHKIGDDSNPAEIIYEILTNPAWGCGRDPGTLDLAAFQDVGDALYDEGFGLTFQFDSQQSAKAQVNEVLRHIDAVMYEDPSTGLWTIRLVRDDYVVGALPVVDETNAADVEFARSGWTEIASVVTVDYTSRADYYTTRPATQPNQAAIEILGDRVIDAHKFEGAMTAPVAQMIAARECKSASYPLAKITVEANRKLWFLRYGDPFVLNWPPLGISSMVFRVTRPSTGELVDGRIRFDAVEDIFGVDSSSFTGPPGSGWTNPVGDPEPLAAEAVIECPFHLIGLEERHGLCLAARSHGTDLGFEVWADRSGGVTYLFEDTVDASFCPTGLLVGAYAKNTAALDPTGFTIDGGIDLESLVSITDEELEGGVNLAIIDQEIVAFRDVTDNLDGTFTLENVLRGALDTVPEDHADNARVYFIRPTGAGLATPNNPIAADGTVAWKLLTFNAAGVLDIGDASALSTTFASRSLKPYPPGNVEIDGVAWPTTHPELTDIVVTWAIRHRLEQYDDLAIVAQDAGDYAAAPEGDYTVKVYADAVLVRTVPAIALTTWTYDVAMQTVDLVGAGVALTIEIIPVNGALVGTLQTRTFNLV